MLLVLRYPPKNRILPLGSFTPISGTTGSGKRTPCLCVSLHSTKSQIFVTFGGAMLPHIFLMKVVTGHVQKSYLYCPQNLKLYLPVQQANTKKYWVSENVLWLSTKILHFTYYRDKPDIFSNQKDSSHKNYLSLRIYIRFILLPGMS